MMRRSFTVVLAAGVLLAVGCSTNNDGSKDTGSVEVKGTWDGNLPAEASLPMVVTGCPLEMPPAYSAAGTVKNGQAHGIVKGIAPGDWCLLTYVDMNPDDGLMPVSGTDVTVKLEPGAKSIPVTVQAAETTTVDVTFVAPGGDADGDADAGADAGEPGPDDVWVRVTIRCATCATTAPVVFYGYAGDTPGTIPDIFNKITKDIAFPLVFEARETGALSQGPYSEGHFIVAAYQDLDNQGMGPETGEPFSDYLAVDLVKGEWNLIDLTMKP